ncbi:MAG: polyhydroxyalkanoate synthesis regulator DNA-binding domain-containing protein [Candidatus Zixiibacteriota bacterium]
MKIIKRYRNRRLYDTEKKEFIVLSDLERMVRQSVELKVIDIASGKDITLSVLTAVIGEQAESWQNPRQSTDMLSAVIKLGGRRSMSILKNTVLAGVGFMTMTKKKAEELIDTLIKSGELSKSEKKEAVLELLAKAEKSTRSTRQRVSEEIEKGIDSLTWAKKSDFDKLVKKVNTLAKKVSSLEKQAKGE